MTSSNAEKMSLRICSIHSSKSAVGVREAPVIILDEATASVDTGTERHIQKALEELGGSHTVIVIAHRLSTVAKADKILVVEGGSIVEEGTHSELTERGGIYAELSAKSEI